MEIFWTVLVCAVVFTIFYLLTVRDYEKQMDELAKSANQEIKILKSKLEMMSFELKLLKKLNHVEKNEKNTD